MSDTRGQVGCQVGVRAWDVIAILEVGEMRPAEDKIYCVDIDGVLCDDRLGDYEHSEPNYEVIQRVNRMYQDGHIIKIFTGRGSATGIDWREFTVRQLESWGVKYHELILGKPVADVFIDDKAVNVCDWVLVS